MLERILGVSVVLFPADEFLAIADTRILSLSAEDARLFSQFQFTRLPDWVLSWW